MSNTGLDVFDKTLQSTHIWLNEIGELIGPDKQRCYHALRAVLTTLRDRMTVEQSAHLSADLPILIRGIFYDGFRPTDVPMTWRSQDEFISVVAQRFGNIGPMSPRTSCIAVFRVMERHLPHPLVEKVRNALPHEIRALFQAETAMDRDTAGRRDTAAERSAAGERGQAAHPGAAGRGTSAGQQGPRNS